MPLPKQFAPKAAVTVSKDGAAAQLPIKFEVYRPPSRPGEKWAIQCHTCADIFELKNEDIRTVLVCPFCSRSGRVDHKKFKKRKEQQEKQSYPCQGCVEELVFVDQYKRWFCKKCKKYN